MECLLLLHSPMIIDMEELSKFEEDLDLINFLSNVDIVCGCIYMKEEHSISFIHEIVLNEEYNMFDDLMSFLLDCALAQMTNESYHIISFCDLHKKIAKYTFPLWLYVTISGVLVYYLISPYYL